MKTAYRVARASLAVFALLGIICFTAWHALLWRMNTVYIAEGGTPGKKRSWLL